MRNSQLTLALALASFLFGCDGRSRHASKDLVDVDGYWKASTLRVSVDWPGSEDDESVEHSDYPFLVDQIGPAVSWAGTVGLAGETDVLFDSAKKYWAFGEESIGTVEIDVSGKGDRSGATIVLDVLITDPSGNVLAEYTVTREFLDLVQIY